MKTAISLPEDTFRRADAAASRLGVSRSGLFATALLHYLDELDRDRVVEEINRAVDLAGADDSNRAAAAAGRVRLADDDEQW